MFCVLRGFIPALLLIWKANKTTTNHHEDLGTEKKIQIQTRTRSFQYVFSRYDFHMRKNLRVYDIKLLIPVFVSENEFGASELHH